MEKRSYLLKAFALLLMLSYLLPLLAVPLSRNLALKNPNLSATEIQATTAKEGRYLGEEMVRTIDNNEINDYPSPHANPRHNRKKPPPPSA